MIRLLLCISLSGVLASPGCLSGTGEGGPVSDAGNDPSTYRLAVGVSLLKQVYLPRLERMVELTTALETEAQTQKQARLDGGEVNFAPLRAAWLAVMEKWQELEVMHIGPAASSATRKGGEDLGDNLYSWPLTNSCRVDQVLVSGIYAEEGFKQRVLVNVFGLDALEELLFRDGDFHTCPPQLAIESEGQWEGLGADGRMNNKIAYVHVLATELRQDAQTLLNRWSSNGDNFIAQAESPGGDSVFSSPQCLLNELFAAVFHLDLITKDKRLAGPTGISRDCTSATCPNLLEFQRAPVSGLAVQGNLRGIAALFSGEDGDGLDALLRQEGADALADQLKTAIDEALDMARSLEVDWSLLLTNDPQALQTLHAKVKAVTDLLKTQFVSVLNLSVPQEGAADND